MKEKQATEIYFHPIVVTMYLLLPLFMGFVTWNLIRSTNSIWLHVLASVFIIMTLIFGILISKIFAHMIIGKPALTLSNDYLIDHHSKLKIEWNDIEDFKFGGRELTYISIKLNQKEKYIAQIQNPLKRKMYQFNSKFFHGTFTLVVSSLKGKNKDIMDFLLQYLEAARATKMLRAST